MSDLDNELAEKVRETAQSLSLLTSVEGGEVVASPLAVAIFGLSTNRIKRRDFRRWDPEFRRKQDAGEVE